MLREFSLSRKSSERENEIRGSDFVFIVWRRVIAGGRVYGIRPLSFRHETFARYRPQNVRAPGSVLERMFLLLFFLTSAFLLFPSGGETVGARAFTPMEGGLPRVTCVK